MFPFILSVDTTEESEGDEADVQEAAQTPVFPGDEDKAEDTTLPFSARKDTYDLLVTACCTSSG